jgi:hypothetical protein
MTTDQALQSIFDYFKRGGEGIAFNFARLTDELTQGDSFMASSSSSAFAPSGNRGVWSTEPGGSPACLCTGGGSQSFPVNLSLDLNNGHLMGQWTAPVGGAITIQAQVHLIEETNTPGTIFLFNARTHERSPFHVLSATLI